MINNAKSVFLAVYLGLTMLVACTQPGFLISYWSARFWTTGRQPPPLSSVLYGIIYKRCPVVAAQVLLREKSGA
jgi:hypothetical protein